MGFSEPHEWFIAQKKGNYLGFLKCKTFQDKTRHYKAMMILMEWIELFTSNSKRDCIKNFDDNKIGITMMPPDFCRSNVTASSGMAIPVTDHRIMQNFGININQAYHMSSFKVNM